MPKLIFFVSEDWYFVSHRLPLAKEAIRRGYEVILVTRVSTFRSELEQSGVRVVPFKTNRRGMNPLRLLLEVFALAKIYRVEKPDLVHHVSLRAAIVGGLAARLCRISGVVSAITGMGFLFAEQGRRPWVRAAVAALIPQALSTGAIVVQNAEDSRQLSQFGISASRQRLIAGAGVDIDKFVPVINENKCLIVMMAARILWDKGVGEFVEAARTCHHTNMRFVLVGMLDGDNPAGVPEKQVRAWTDEGIVEWWGHRHQMAETLAQADIFCLPSYREGLPKVILEAMASGKACISTDVAGCRDVVQHGETGILVPPRNATALASAIVTLATNSAQRETMAKNARRIAVERFRDSKITSETIDVYEEILSSRL